MAESHDHNHSHFLMAPLEVRHAIYALLTGPLPAIIDVSMAPTRTRGCEPRRFKHSYPQAILDTRNLIRCHNHQLVTELAGFLAGTTTFQGIHSSNLLNMPPMFGKVECSMIERFDVRWEFDQKLFDQEYWPQLIEMFAKSLPKLTHLRLYTDCLANRGPFPEHESRDPEGSMTRFDQDNRCKLRFLSFLIQNHPNLDLLVRPADDGHIPIQITQIRWKHAYLAEKYQAKGRKWSCQEYFKAEPFDKEIRDWQIPLPGDVSQNGPHFPLWQDVALSPAVQPSFLGSGEHEQEPQASNINSHAVTNHVDLGISATRYRERITVHDEVLNATKLMRLTWGEYHNLAITQFFIYPDSGLSKDSIQTSLPADSDSRFYTKLLQCGYKTDVWLRQHGFPTSHLEAVDDIILAARRDKVHDEKFGAHEKQSKAVASSGEIRTQRIGNNRSLNRPLVVGLHRNTV